MKFFQLFEDTHTDVTKAARKTPCGEGEGRYNQDMINHVRKLIRDNETKAPQSEQPDNEIQEIPGQMLYDQDTPDQDYFLDDDVYDEFIKNQAEKNNTGLDEPEGLDVLDEPEELDVLGEPEEPDEPEVTKDVITPAGTGDSNDISSRMLYNIDHDGADYFLSDEAGPAKSIIKPLSQIVPAQTLSAQPTQPVSEDDSDDLKDEIKDVDVKDTENPEMLELYNKLIDLIQEKDYDDAVDFVDDIVKDPKLKFLLSLGFGGEFSDLELELKKKTIPAKRLVPTQNEIGTDETLKYLLQGKDIDVCFDKTTIVKKPIVTFQGTFIIDGHHRWSQIFVTNPDANIVCIDITGNLSPLSMLKAVQCTIGSNIGKLIRKDIQGKNLYNTSEKELRKYFKDNLSDAVRENLLKYYEDPVESLIRNIIQLQQNNKPILNAPDRGEMPQTSKDPELFGDLKNGVTEV